MKTPKRKKCNGIGYIIRGDRILEGTTEGEEEEVHDWRSERTKVRRKWTDIQYANR